MATGAADFKQLRQKPEKKGVPGIKGPRQLENSTRAMSVDGPTRLGFPFDLTTFPRVDKRPTFNEIPLLSSWSPRA
jgi:hypothetical protein